jgi:hypothetical protein
MATYNPGTGPYNNPQITISTPLQPPGQQLTSAGANPTIQGTIDGINSLFVVGIWFPQMEIWVNGLLQEINKDCVIGPTVIKFLPGSIPQPGSIITLNGFGTL